MQATQREVEIDGNHYRTGLLTAQQQFHVYRRLMPLLTDLNTAANIAAAVAATEAVEAEKKADMWAMLQGPVLNSLAKMSDETVDYVLATCLTVCERRVDSGQSQAWARVAVPTANGFAMAYNDIAMVAMLRLVAETVQGNLGNFFDLLGALS